MPSRPLLVAWLAALAGACDPVPDLYVVDGSIDSGNAADSPAAGDAPPVTDGGLDSPAEEASPACNGTGVSCPDCPPNPGACCANDVPCYGANCAAACATCATCNGMCCSKQGGPPMCHDRDAGKCPP